MEQVQKPWGTYTDYFRSNECVFKKIEIAPKLAFSFQIHHLRDEIWYIISGRGTLKMASPGDDPSYNYSIEEVLPGMTIQVPREFAHQLRNIGDEPLVLYETQTGECSEEDIIRISDDFGRVKEQL